jgi:phosphohistidine phosphatase SixA
MPDIIVSSDFTRAYQTAEAAQKILSDLYGKEVTLVTTSKL